MFCQSSLTCKSLHAAVNDLFCDAYVAHLGCWMLSKMRWERKYSLMTASTSLFRRIRTVMFAVDGLELVNRNDNPRHGRIVPHWLNQSRCKKTSDVVRYNPVEEEAGLQQQGVADYALMVRVLQQLKARGCLLHLNLSPGDPLARMIHHPR